MLKLIAKSLISFGLLVGVIQAQQPTQHIVAGPTLPSRCSQLTGDVWILTSSPFGLNFCGPNGTWLSALTSIPSSITATSFFTGNISLSGNSSISSLVIQPISGSSLGRLDLLPTGSLTQARLNLWNGNDSSFTNNSEFEIALIGPTARLQTSTSGTGRSITSLIIGELNGTSNLTSIAFQFGGVTLASLSSAGNYTPALYGSITECNSGASPAVCGAAPSGSIAVPAGTNSTLQVNTTAVTANSQIVLTSDSTANVAATTCNTTAASIALPPAITARSAGTSFTITLTGTTATNPVCFNYFIIN